MMKLMKNLIKRFFKESGAKIWILIKANIGISCKFLLSRLQNFKEEWFLDSATSWGIGGCCGYRYFSLNNDKLFLFFELYNSYTNKSNMLISCTRPPVAYLEVLAAVVGLAAFSAFDSNSIVRLNRVEV